MPATKTNAAYGDKTNMVQQAVGLFATHMQRNSTLNRLTGKMPKGTAGANATLRKQTTQHMPIVRCQDLGKGRGDEVTFHLLNPVGAKPIMGSRYAEGRGTGISLTEDKLRVDQARFPLDLGNTMTTIRSPVEFRAVGPDCAEPDGSLCRPVPSGSHGRCARLPQQHRVGCSDHCRCRP